MMDTGLLDYMLSANSWAFRIALSGATEVDLR